MVERREWRKESGDGLEYFILENGILRHLAFEAKLGTNGASDLKMIYDRRINVAKLEEQQRVALESGDLAALERYYEQMEEYNQLLADATEKFPET